MWQTNFQMKLHFKAQHLSSLCEVAGLAFLFSNLINIPFCSAQSMRWYLSNISSASTPILPLTIEEHCSYRRSKIIERRKVSRVEILSPSWCINGLLDRLAEEYKDKAMYSSSWLWVFIADNFISCNKICSTMSQC